MTKPVGLIGLCAIAALSACAGGSENTANRAVWVADGPPVNCINNSQIRSFRVIDDRTVDFERNRNQAWRNNLPFRCSGLSFGSKFRHNSRTSQLCSMNSITVINPGAAPNGPTCQLGQFQPMKRVPVPEPSATGG